MLLLAFVCGADKMPGAQGAISLRGILQDSTGKPLAEAMVELRSADMRRTEAPLQHAKTDLQGSFEIGRLSAGRYAISAHPADQSAPASTELTIEASDQLVVLILVIGRGELSLQVRKNADASADQAQATDREKLESQQVAGLPLEQRDSTNLLLLAAGTQMTTGTGANFTQQYSIHGQKGTTALFALDGADTTDPENGGATISDFNVDAIRRIENFSGVMPASIGQGAAGYINVISKSGSNGVHGNLYEFMRNSIFDARNYFDPAPSVISRRIPPFIRNEFGGTNGGPVVIPGVYNGRDRTFYFIEYQGLRQVLGTTQVLSVPTDAERSGLDTTAFSGDTLYVPLNSQIRQLLSIYPHPNNPNGTYGPRTYMAASNVYTTNNQFSVRIDHRISKDQELMGRFTMENIIGPTTNPSQTAIDPSYAQLFTEGYRSAVLHYVRVPSSTLTMVSTVGFIRSTPQYASLNQTQPGLTFANKLFEAINSQAGGFRGLTGNQLQLRQTLAKIHGVHSFEMGVEVRFDRNAEINSNNVNGTFAFGGGPAYSPVTITSASGQHNINPGDLLPDTLSSFLTGTPSSYTRTIGGRGFSQGNLVAMNSIHRDAYNFYFLDNWRVSSRLMLAFGLRYELNTPMRVGKNRAQGALFSAPDGSRLYYPTPGATQQWVVNPDPIWNTDWNGWGPRLSVSWQASKNTLLRAAAGITTLVQYPWPNISITNHFPYAV
ncbi:MAG TPA: TonB-dependent receptor plug domain-containing protein, partial [Acidobacteriota bacterium]|nr:TonB-dependent receptor plug domain-containing protein [Acidobacteriota bacterium]